MRTPSLLLPLIALALQGCIARTAWDVATMPVKATSQVVDWSTTSQEEADRNYGRKARQQEAREGKERKEFEKRCRKHRDDPACARYDGYRSGYGE